MHYSPVGRMEYNWQYRTKYKNMRNLHQKVHHHLKLQHHRHTGKLLRHEHTSYRGLAVVLVLASVVVVAAAMVQRAAADTLFGVYATVQGPVPGTGAIITQPDAGSIASGDTLVAGSCPIISPQVTVVLLVDNTPAGSSMCDTANDFALPVNLTPGAHTLVAQSYTINLGQGPDSQPVNITAQDTGAKPVQPNAPVLSPDMPFNVLGTDRSAEWSGSITGGTAPYHVLIDWGDGTRNTYKLAAADSPHYTHHYIRLASYNTRIAVQDATGSSVQQQFAAVAYTTFGAAAAASTTTNDDVNRPMVAGLYGLFLTVLSISCIIWLEAKHTARHGGMPV